MAGRDTMIGRRGGGGEGEGGNEQKKHKDTRGNRELSELMDGMRGYIYSRDGSVL